MLRPAILAAAAAVFVPAALPAQSQVRPDPRVEAAVAGISAERLGELVDRLASFETRHTLSSADHPTRGIGAARQWMHEVLQSYSPRLQVTFDTHIVPPAGRITREVELRNVVAVLPGRSTRRIYVSGHYDSVVIGADPDDPAPGANDDGSGTALMMEIARVLANSGLDFDATLVFIGFAGEEQGLVGARLHVADMARNGQRIDAVFNNDIVGNTRGGNGIEDGASVRVFSGGPEDSPSRQLARYVRRTAAAYVPAHEVRLIAREDRFGRGGDHTPFDQHGYAAVRFTESKEDYSRQHTVRDTPDGVDTEYLARNARVNIAGVASLALAPAAPGVLDDRGNPTLGRGNGYDAQLRWQPSPGAVGYRVFRREAWGPDWQHAIDVGNVTEHVFADLSIDDHIFGVAAVGPAGNESLISVYVRPPRDWSQVR